MFTYTKVSGRVNTIRNKQVPANNAKVQNVHLQDTPETDMKPLTMGAREGPANGAAAKTPRALPLVLASQMSEITALRITRQQKINEHRQERTYPLFVRGADANTPPRNRKTRIEPVFRERAQPTWKPVYRMNVKINIGRRPYCSESGPHNSGPTQYPPTKSAIQSTATS